MITGMSNEHSMRDYLDVMRQRALDKIRHLTNAEVLSQTVEQWVDAIIVEFASPDIPVIYPDRLTRSSTQGQVPAFNVPNPKYAQVPMQQGLIHQFHLPFTGNRNFFHYQPNGWTGDFPGADVLSDELLLAMGGSWLTPDSIEKEVESHVADIGRALDGFRADAARFKQDFPATVRSHISNRRDTAELEARTSAALKYPLKKVDGAQQTYKLPERPKTIAPKPVQVPKAAEPEWVLDDADYLEILRICTSMSSVMERSPTVFEEAEEEHIRVHYLVQLNGQFRGAATGETFNNKGKTDILIREGDKNVFVAECKFWGGYKDHLATVSQLLSYTTWRDTKTAIIVFNRNQDFTNVISEAQRAMRDHQNYRSGPINEGETRFRYIFKHPDDALRDIIVTLLLFNMPKPA